MSRYLVVVALIATTLIPAESSNASTTDITAWEQWFVYELNRARWNPNQYAAEHGVALKAPLGALPPLAMNPQLVSSARFKASEMAEFDYFGHRSKESGLWPNELVRLHGFSLASFISDEDNNVESIWGGNGNNWPTPATFLASGIHVHSLFAASEHWWYESVNQVGVGRAKSGSEQRVAIHLGRTDSPGRFVTGVAYRDANGNGRMDLGEGLAGILVTVGASSALTNDGGGYSIQVPSGKMNATASGQGFSGTSAATIRVDDYNVGVDFISGRSTAEVRAFDRCRGHRPTIMGTAGKDLLHGTSGDDIIHGLDGNDRIWGYGGNDTLCGGRGNDRLRGAGGNDSLYGGKGRDRLFGGSGTNHLDGGAGKMDKCVDGFKVRCEL